jgi:hypothetical protein
MATFMLTPEPARLKIKATVVAVTSGAGARRFFADVSASVPAAQPVENSMAAILSVTRRHGVALAGA